MSCLTCGAGRYNDGGDGGDGVPQAYCAECPAGRSTPALELGFGIAGVEAQRNGLDKCLACKPSEYRPINAGTGGCTDVPPGFLGVRSGGDGVKFNPVHAKFVSWQGNRRKCLPEFLLLLIRKGQATSKV